MPTDALDLTVETERALRDIASGHLSIWRCADGADRPDSTVDGGEATWLALEAAGLIAAPDSPGAWTLTATGSDIAAVRGW